MASCAWATSSAKSRSQWCLTHRVVVKTKFSVLCKAITVRLGTGEPMVVLQLFMSLSLMMTFWLMMVMVLLMSLLMMIML